MANRHYQYCGLPNASTLNMVIDMQRRANELHMVLALDFKNAFVTIAWPFFWAAMQAANLLGWVQRNIWDFCVNSEIYSTRREFTITVARGSSTDVHGAQQFSH